MQPLTTQNEDQAEDVKLNLYFTRHMNFSILGQ